MYSEEYGIIIPVNSILIYKDQALKNRPSDRPGRCLKLRGRIHTVPVTSDWPSVFSGHPSQNSVPKLTYFKTQSYLVLSLAL